MTSTHPSVTLYVGDDWSIGSTILDSDGNVYPLAGKVLQWVLATRGGLAHVIAPADVSIEVVSDVEGTILIRVPSEVTSQIAPGRYYDALRISDSSSPGITETFMTGMIHVMDSGFAASDSPPV